MYLSFPLQNCKYLPLHLPYSKAPAQVTICEILNIFSLSYGHGIYKIPGPKYIKHSLAKAWIMNECLFILSALPNVLTFI